MPTPPDAVFRLDWRWNVVTGVVAALHGGFDKAHVKPLVCFGIRGIRQGDLAENVGFTQNAVHQVFDDLVQDGDRIKVQIAARWRTLLGDDGFERLNSALRQVTALSEPSALPRKPQGGKKD